MNNGSAGVRTPAFLPPRLLEKYDVPGPRYTSYPTIRQLREEFSRERAEREWRANGSGRLAVYCHLPFCRNRCAYCGCHTETGHDPETADAYIAAVLKEAAAARDVLGTGRPVEHLALGGGTPNFLLPRQMEDLVIGLDMIFPLAEARERSIEINPETLDGSYLDYLVSLGFNRFSFGVQDLDPEVQTLVQRPVNEAHLDFLIDRLRRQRVTANLDLIYGLPGQTEASFGRTLDRIIALQPSRLALFGYAHLPEKFPHQRRIDPSRLPGTRLRLALAALGRQRLLEADYAAVGMDHFARPDDALLAARDQRRLTRNFMGYAVSQGQAVIGLGASAISSAGIALTQNRKAVAEYLAWSPPGLPWAGGLLLTPEDQLRQGILQELMCYFHLDIRELEAARGVVFARHFSAESVRLREMEADGLLALTPAAVQVTDLGKFFIRNICMVFDQYLDQHPSPFSRTL